MRNVVLGISILMLIAVSVQGMSVEIVDSGWSLKLIDLKTGNGTMMIVSGPENTTVRILTESENVSDFINTQIANETVPIAIVPNETAEFVILSPAPKPAPKKDFDL